MSNHVGEERLLGMEDLVRIFGRSRASIYRDIQRGDFPPPLRVGSSSRWRQKDVADFIDGLDQARFQAQ